jgi:hypothetical protein
LIYQLGTNELNGLADGTAITLVNTPFDVGDEATLPSDAKGQAIIALKDSSGKSFLFALYLVSNAAQTQYDPSILVKLSVGSGGALTYDDQIDTLGLNAQEIIPVTNTAGNVTLLIPSIGGAQQYGSTNGNKSLIEAVPAFTSPFTATIRITGDPAATTPTAYDFRAIAATTRAGDDGLVYILTGYFDTYGVFFTWALYKTTVAQLLALTGQTISQAVASGALTLAGTEEEDPGGFFWDIYYEHGDNEGGDRLWFLRGSPILVTLARDYPNPSAVNYTRGSGVGKIGGANVNSADLTSEMIRQVRAGVSLKRGLHGLSPAHKAAAIKAAAKAATEEKEEENK